MQLIYIHDRHTGIKTFTKQNLVVLCIIMLFAHRGDKLSTAVSTNAWIPINSGSLIPSTSRYMQWKADFGITNSTHNPYLDRVTVFRTESSGGIQPSNAVVWNDEYWLSHTSSGSTINDNILIMNKDGAFSLFDNLNVYGLAVMSNALYSGDSIIDGASGGYVRQLDAGNTDDGAPVFVYVQTKDYPMESLEDYQKNLTSLFFDYEIDAGTMTWEMNKDFVPSGQSGIITYTVSPPYKRSKIDFNQQSVGRTFGMTFANNYINSKLKLYPPLNFHFSKTRILPPQ